MIFYHIDRNCYFQTKGTIEIPYKNKDLPFGNIFPTVSQHGYRYFCLAPQITSPIAAYIYELALEYVRALKYPQYPSRFQCLFAHKSKEDAFKWLKFYVKNNQPFQLIEIEAEHYFEFDVSWISPELRNPLTLEISTDYNSLGTFSSIANAYWSKKTDNPILELLIPYPFQIKRIEKYLHTNPITPIT